MSWEFGVAAFIEQLPYARHKLVLAHSESGRDLCKHVVKKVLSVWENLA